MDKVQKPIKNLKHPFLPYNVSYCQPEDPVEQQKCHICRTQMKFRIGVFNSRETSWYHLDCFFKMMTKEIVEISFDHFDGIDAVKLYHQKQLLIELRKYQRLKPKEPESREYFIRAEENESVVTTSDDKKILFLHLAKILKATETQPCSNCKRKIRRNYYYLEINGKLYHYYCSIKLRNVVGNAEQMDGFHSFSGNLQKEFIIKVEKRKSQAKEKNIDSNFLTALGYPDHFVPVLSVMNAFIWNAEITVECRKCFQEIKQGELVFHYNNANVHPRCLFLSVRMVVDEPEDIPGWSEFPDVVKKTTRMDYDLAVIFLLVRAVSFNSNSISDKTSLKRVHEEEAEESSSEETVAKICKLETGQQKMNDSHLAMEEQFSTIKKLKSQYDFLSDQLIVRVLLHNHQVVFHDIRNLLMETLIDCMVFGAPEPCLFCYGFIVFNASERIYKCHGNGSPYSKCNYRSTNPSRTPIQIPASCDDFFDSADFNKFEARLYVDNKSRTSSTNAINVPPEIQEIAYSSQVPLDTALLTNFNTKYLYRGKAAIPYEYHDDWYIVVNRWTGELFEAFLTKVEVQDNRNSCIQLYILHSEKKQEYIVLKMQSRIGTDIAMKKTWEFKEYNDASLHFRNEFFQETGNFWETRAYFVKYGARYNNVPFTYDYLDVRHDIMLEFVAKNQLAGRITDSSRETLQKMLNQLEADLVSGNLTEFDFIDVTNKFYSMFPVCSGFVSHEIINSKIEIEKARRLLNENSVVSFPETFVKTRLDLTLKHEGYQAMKYLKRDSDDWKLVAEYCGKTHGATHDARLSLIDIVRIERPGRSTTVFPETKILLWHGTKRKNIESILKNGLMLNPPAARTGAMFGRGIYFADCFSKSFNYADTKNDTDAYLFLCEVALGMTCEANNALSDEEIQRALNAGFNSVKGMGQTFPPTRKLVNNVYVPEGPLQSNPVFQTALLYNEYIIYDERRVTLRYMVRVRRY